MLCKQSLIINKKLIGLSLAGFVGILFLTLIVFQSSVEFNRWENKDSNVIFVFLFLQLGILYAGLSFPAFRSKEKSMVYLMLPATASEKYIFEIVTRILVFIFIMPLLFYVVANLEGMIVHYFVPELTNYRFSFHGSKDVHIENEGWISYAIVQGFLFVFVACFTGASHFTKSPLVKTLFSFPVLIAGYGLYALLLFKTLHLKGIRVDDNFFLKNEHDALVFIAILATIINLSLLAIAWFRLKEKEA
jgi:hypothetical protein